jgi:hypothetical protein
VAFPRGIGIIDTMIEPTFLRGNAEQVLGLTD